MRSGWNGEASFYYAYEPKPYRGIAQVHSRDTPYETKVVSEDDWRFFDGLTHDSAEMPRTRC